ncbi:Transmembrane protein 135 [Portunus trituberculatus]|uniref:Transmembrane protein 135 n=1 Tax=Portunus trituberculatus TaxID=210409 RepID=A0A5B7CV12_PORTR|nr:Transmembrane protein 135 [Portunus trituberculatus]
MTLPIHILQHFNFLTVSFVPGFIGSLMAILVERPARRTLLAIYVTNVASECLWNSAVGHGYVSSIPCGEILLTHKSRSSIVKGDRVFLLVRVFLGKEESGLMVSHRQTAARQECIPHQPVPWHQKLLALITSKHYLCPHRGGCVPHFIWGTCCGGRWWHGEDRPESGAIAGVLAALSMYFYSAPSLALYMMWKVVEDTIVTSLLLMDLTVARIIQATGLTMT